MLCYIARRHGEVELQELARFLQVKELSTASHAVRRAEARLKNNSGFSRRVDQILKRLYSSMQVCPSYSPLRLEPRQVHSSRFDPRPT